MGVRSHDPVKKPKDGLLVNNGRLPAGAGFSDGSTPLGIVLVATAVHVVGEPTATDVGEQEKVNAKLTPGVTGSCVSAVLPPKTPQIAEFPARYGVHVTEHAASPDEPVGASEHVDAPDANAPLPLRWNFTVPVGVAPGVAALATNVHTVETRERTGLGEHEIVGPGGVGGVKDGVTAMSVDAGSGVLT